MSLSSLPMLLLPPGAADRPGNSPSRTSASSLLVALLVGITGCAGLPPMPAIGPDDFQTGTAALISGGDTLRIGVQIAETEAERQVGLTGRDSIPENGGMIFLFDEEQPEDSGFWMYRTTIPLSLAYFDAEGTIIRIMEMEPCTRRVSAMCPQYPPGLPFSGGLEVNRGFFERHGISEGDRIVLLRD